MFESTDVYVTTPTTVDPDTDPLQDRCPYGCEGFYGVRWRASLPHADGTRQILQFRAPDVESVRTVLRYAGIRIDDIVASRPAPQARRRDGAPGDHGPAE